MTRPAPPNLLDHLDSVEELLRTGPFGLFTDVDGTIAPTSPRPEGARVEPACAESLASLAGRIALVAAVSGRSMDDLRRMLPVDGVVYVANHGLERWREDHSEVASAAQAHYGGVRRALAEVSAALDGDGWAVEDKGVTVAFHYRLAADPVSAERRLRDAIERSPAADGLRVESGKMLIEIKPPVEISKGTALEGLAREFRLGAGVYVGDDRTDITALLAMKGLARQGFRGLGVGVLGGRETPPGLLEACDYSLGSVSEVCRFYGWLAEQSRGFERG